MIAVIGSYIAIRLANALWIDSVLSGLHLRSVSGAKKRQRFLSITLCWLGSVSLSLVFEDGDSLFVNETVSCKEPTASRSFDGINL